MARQTIKVVILEDYLRALYRIKILLEHFSAVQVVSEFEKSEKAQDCIITNGPELAFMDLEMPGKSRIGVAKNTNKNYLNTKIVFITGHENYAIKAIKNPAFDYFLK